LCDAATPGPWTETDAVNLPNLNRLAGGILEGDSDAKFVAASRTALPRLLDEMERIPGIAAQMLGDLSRLRAVEKAAKEWEAASPGDIDEDTAFDYAYVARAILAGYGPEGKVKPWNTQTSKK